LPVLDKKNGLWTVRKVLDPLYINMPKPSLRKLYFQS
jgi:hypothetical protein